MSIPRQDSTLLFEGKLLPVREGIPRPVDGALALAFESLLSHQQVRLLSTKVGMDLEDPTGNGMH